MVLPVMSGKIEKNQQLILTKAGRGDIRLNLFWCRINNAPVAQLDRATDF